MNAFINKSGLLSIMLVVLAGTLTGHAAPLAEREGIANGKTSHEVFDACKDIGTSANSNKIVSWQEMCRSTLLPTNHLGSSYSSFHHDLLVGDIAHQVQIKSDESVKCLGESRASSAVPGNNCISIGVPGVISLAGTPMISDSFQSLYEFELPEFESQWRDSRKVFLPYKGRVYPIYSENIVTDQNRFSRDAGVPLNMQLLALQREESKNLSFWDYDYQIEVSDTLTRFIPKSNLVSRSVEMGDLIPVLLLGLLLPDYRKLRFLLGGIFVRKTLKR